MNDFITEGEIVTIMQALIRCPSVNPPAETAECARVYFIKTDRAKRFRSHCR